MSFLVVNCFHWIGYHIVDHLLNSNEKVDGIDKIDSEIKEHLSMFVGRNDRFQLIKEDKNTDYDAVIVVHSDLYKPKHPQVKLLRITNPIEDRQTHENETIIGVPLLFGEWMPMDEKGVYINGEKILFESERFSKEGVYIKNFVQSLHQCLQTSNLASTINVRSCKNLQKDYKGLENYIYIRDNIPIDKNMNRLLEHYAQFKEFYPKHLS